MNPFLFLPDWAPGWLGPVLVTLGALFALAFLLMPFTVFGLKSRLDQIELKLEELHAELRELAPMQARGLPPEPPPAPSERYPVRPPIPPPLPRGATATPRNSDADATRVPDLRVRGRAEPRLDWPRR